MCYIKMLLSKEKNIYSFILEMSQGDQEQVFELADIAELMGEETENYVIIKEDRNAMKCGI